MEEEKKVKQVFYLIADADIVAGFLFSISTLLSLSPFLHHSLSISTYNKLLYRIWRTFKWKENK